MLESQISINSFGALMYKKLIKSCVYVQAVTCIVKSLQASVQIKKKNLGIRRMPAGCPVHEIWTSAKDFGYP